MQKPFNFVTQLYLPYLRISRSLFVKSTIAHGLFPKVHPSLPLLADKIQKSSSFFRETFPIEHLVVLFYMQNPCNFVTQLYLPYLRHSRSLFVKSYHTWSWFVSKGASLLSLAGGRWTRFFLTFHFISIVNEEWRWSIKRQLKLIKSYHEMMNE